MSENTTVEQRLDRIERLLREQKTVLNFAEACEFTGLSKTYMYKLTHQGRILHFKPHGKNIYFNREELERWLLQNPVRTAEQKEREAVDYVVRKRRPRWHFIRPALALQSGSDFLSISKASLCFCSTKTYRRTSGAHPAGLLTRNHPMK